MYQNNSTKQNLEVVTVWNYQNADCILRKNIIASFNIIFGTSSFPVDFRDDFGTLLGGDPRSWAKIPAVYLTWCLYGWLTWRLWLIFHSLLEAAITTTWTCYLLLEVDGGRWKCETWKCEKRESMEHRMLHMSVHCRAGMHESTRKSTRFRRQLCSCERLTPDKQLEQ